MSTPPRPESSPNKFSFIETEPLSVDNMSLLMEDEVLQDIFEDYQEASFDDAFYELHHPQTVE